MNPIIAHRQPSEAEFHALADRLGIDPGCSVDPRTELTYAMGRRACSTCTSKDRCRLALRRSPFTLNEFASFCPTMEMLLDLLHGHPTHRRDH
jgi:hypothetical protein